LKAGRHDIPSLEEKIGYVFRDKSLAAEALTHKSYSHEHPKKAPAHNERLEFLGDSVLGLAVADYLFRLNTGHRESAMSKVKSFIVKGKILSDVARELSLGEHLLLGKGEDDTGGREKDSILSDALEAIIGAVYMDAGLEKARELVLRLLVGKMDDAMSSGGVVDYKSDLQEICQMKFGVLPEYLLIKQGGEEHRKTFVYEVRISGKCYGKGKGRSKKDAQTEAAREAVSALSGE